MSVLDRVNPVTPLAAAVLYSVPMLLTIDVVTAAVALGAWLLAGGVSLSMAAVLLDALTRALG